MSFNHDHVLDRDLPEKSQLTFNFIFTYKTCSDCTCLMIHPLSSWALIESLYSSSGMVSKFFDSLIATKTWLNFMLRDRRIFSTHTNIWHGISKPVHLVCHRHVSSKLDLTDSLSSTTSYSNSILRVWSQIFFSLSTPSFLLINFFWNLSVIKEIQGSR